MYETRFGVTKIIDGEWEKFDISRDSDLDWNDVKIPIAVFLHVPNINRQEHSHIAMTKEQCVILRDWLNKFIDDPSPLKKDNNE